MLVDVPLNNLMRNTDDYKVTSIKIDNVEELIRAQEQKIDYSK